MTPSLYIKQEDGKIYLIPDCPERGFLPEGTEKYDDNRRSLEKAKASAILVENQEYALGLMSPVEKLHNSLYTLKLMPGLKYRLQHQFWCFGWSNCLEHEYDNFKKLGDVQIVAILEEPVKQENGQQKQEESQDKLFDDLFSRYLKMLHEGMSGYQIVENLKQQFKIERR